MSGARRFFWCVLRLGFAYPKKYKLEKERNTMNKVEDFINTTKLNDLLNKKEELINHAFYDLSFFHKFLAFLFHQL